MGHRLELHTVFDVEISERSRSLVERLSKSPYDVFSRPYLGYMLFLFPQVDSAALSWVRQYGLALDSLTGSDVGFMVVGARIPLEMEKITQQQIKSRRRPPSYQSEISSWDVRDLVVSGRLQFGDLPEDARNTFVVNEAVYAIARELAITQHLPCIVAFDGLPQPDLPYICIPIREGNAERLYAAIQTAIGALLQQSTILGYRADITHLATGAKRLEAAKWKLPGLREELRLLRLREGLLHRQLSSTYPDMVRQCKESIERGQQGHLAVLLARLKTRFPTLDFDDSRPNEIQWAELTRFRKTIHMLGRYASRPWPLDAEAKGRLTSIYENHARSLVDDLPARPSWHSATAVDEVCRRLNTGWRRKTEDLMAGFPPSSGDHLIEHAALESERFKIRAEIAEMVSRLEATEEEIVTEEWQLVHTTHRISSLVSRPSFCAALQAHCADAAIPVDPASQRQQQPTEEGNFWPSWVPVHELLDWIRNRSFSRFPKSMQARTAPGKEFNWHRPPTAFASYASADRPEVLRRVQGMRAWQPGLDVFLDFHSLFPGELWRERLEQEIRQRDRFLLFWSKEARHSEYVEHEWRTALRCHGLRAITPIPLQSPDEAPPPDALSALHFNDLFLEMLRYDRPSPAVLR